MTREKAQALGIRSIADLAAHAGKLTIAGDYEFFARPEWEALAQRLRPAVQGAAQMQPEFMYKAVAAGDVDVISAYTSDGQIAINDLVVLDDVRHAIPPYDAILLLSPKRAHDDKLINAVKPLIGAIPVDLMREANARASGGTSTDAIARWLGEKLRP